MKLTAEQILTFEEFVADKKSIELTLKIALGYHANRNSELLKVEREFWEELGRIHNLDLNRIHRIENINGMTQIVEVENGEEK